MNIALTGFMGTGKSSVGRILAEKLSYQFIDTDESIEKDTKMTVSEIFAKKGEPYFRDVETKIIALVSLLDKAVIATGGGVVLRQSNMQELKRSGKIVNLRASPETIFSRLKNDSTRPLLKKPDPLAEIKRLLAEREKFYKNCDVAIDTDGLEPKEIAQKILTALKTSLGSR